MTISQKTLLSFIQSYFATLGLAEEAAAFFTAQRFDTGLVLCLPDVCLLPSNKPETSRSKQTHIHVTGDNRYFFFPAPEIDAATESSSDRKQPAVLSKANVQHMTDRTLHTFSSMENCDTFFMKKIAYRMTQDAQVQISKVRQDDREFIRLRKALYTHDLLIFLKYKNSDRLFAVGIPAEFYQGSYELPQEGLLKHLESPGSVTVKSALKEVSDSVDAGAMITGAEAISDSIYQQLVNEADGDISPAEYAAEKYSPPAAERSVSSDRPATNPRLGKAAIKRSGYKCIFSTDAEPHKTFLKPDGTPYLEVHHLIPLKQQPAFEYKLDTMANLIPLCPLCHRRLHHGCRADVDEMLTQLYEERHEILKQYHLSITLKQLKSFY